MRHDRELQARVAAHEAGLTLATAKSLWGEPTTGPMPLLQGDSYRWRFSGVTAQILVDATTGALMSADAR